MDNQTKDKIMDLVSNTTLCCERIADQCRVNTNVVIEVVNSETGMGLQAYRAALESAKRRISQCVR